MRRLGLIVLVAGCGTVASPGAGDHNLPSAGMGPFNPLAQSDVAHGDVAPFVFVNHNAADGYREPSVLPATSDPSSTAVLLYAVAVRQGASSIVRTRADDGRSFYGDTADGSNPPRAPSVLTATLGWEGKDLSGPSALRVGGDVWLYYAAAGGIGLAKSPDGTTFTKTGSPVLGPDHGVGWEFTPPRAPSVAVFPDGSFHMLFASGDAVGEATSPDGEHWTRADADPSTPELDPVLGPSAAATPAAFDQGAVDDPLLLPETDASGRLVVRVLYTGYAQPVGAAARSSAIGFAARFGSSGTLTRQPAPVYSAQSGEAAPALFAWGDGQAMLYVQQADSPLAMALGVPPFPAIAAGYAPASSSPPPLGTYPANP